MRETMPHRRMITPAFTTADWASLLDSSRADAPGTRDALTRLCRTYWQPLYAYVRMRGYSPEDAQELTHRFFARLTESNLSDELSDARARLRSFFLTELRRFLDAAPSEARNAGQPADSANAEKLFEQNWALALLNVVYDRLRYEYESSDKAEIFETLKFCLTSRGDPAPAGDLARKLGVAEPTLKILTDRLRKRFLEILREEAAHSVASPQEVDEELKRLSVALSS